MTYIHFRILDDVTEANGAGDLEWSEIWFLLSEELNQNQKASILDEKENLGSRLGLP